MSFLPGLGTAQNLAIGAGNIALVTPTVNVGMQPQPKGSTQDKGSTATAVARLLGLVEPPPNQGLVFHVVDDDGVKLRSDVTDHYVEDNTAIQDHVALRPEEVRVRGFIAELSDIVPAGFKPVQNLAQRLGTLEPFVPGITTSARSAFNKANQVVATATSLARTATNAWDTIAGDGGPVLDPVTGLKLYPSQNKQQRMFVKFYGYWRARQLFTVQTPWALFTDMIILDLAVDQDEETRTVTSFEVTFKKMRFAQTILSNKAFSLSGRAAAQAFSEVDLGRIAPRAGIPIGAAIGGLA
jgi:hypothetical protein